MSDGVLTEAYERFHRTGLEWGAEQLTNHGPMAVEVLIRAVGHGDEHVIKFTDTAAEVYARTGLVQALAAALHVGTLIPSPALGRPDLVRRLVLAAGVFHHDGWAERILDDEPPEFLRTSYGEVSPDGIGHYDVIAAKLAAMHASQPALTEGDLGRIGCRTLVMVADDDQVRLEHAVAMYRSLPDAELAVVPGTSHGLLVEKPDLCNLLITQFMTQDPVQTFAPIRRAARQPG
jgi:pimeloyl-ACP methyl ester carboxylesterase